MEHFTEFGENCIIQENTIVGLKYRDDCNKAKIGIML